MLVPLKLSHYRPVPGTRDLPLLPPGKLQTSKVGEPSLSPRPTHPEVPGWAAWDGAERISQPSCRTLASMGPGPNTALPLTPHQHQEGQWPGLAIHRASPPTPHAKDPDTVITSGHTFIKWLKVSPKLGH